MSKTISAGIDEIVIINDFNVRANQLSQEKIAEYAEIYDKLPHASVFEVDEKLYLVDGWHRMEAARKLGKESVYVNLVGKGSLLDAQDEADKANLTHGIMLTSQQRKDVAFRFMSRHPDWSQRQVADVMGVQHTTVGRWLNDQAKRSGANAPVDDQKQNKQSASQDSRAQNVDAKHVLTEFTKWRNRQPKTLKDWSPRAIEYAIEHLKPVVSLYNELSEL